MGQPQERGILLKFLLDTKPELEFFEPLMAF